MAGSVSLPDLVQRISIDTSSVGGALSTLQQFGTSTAAMAAGVGAAAVGVGLGLFKIGATFDDMRDKIITGTGASGDAIDDLYESAKRIGKDTPSSFDDIGTAVTELNTRLGLTGQPLEDTAKRVLALSRLTGTDLNTNIANVTRVFGDWGIEASKQPLAMDAIFEATKRTGIGLDKLTQNVVQFGAPLRQLGFSFEESLALFGKWEKEGVNTETILGGVRQAIGRMAKEGLDPAKEFPRVLDDIKGIGNAGEATAKAIEVFGQRAGPDMAAAIREGRFEIGGLVDSLKNSGGALKDADMETRDFAESWQIIKNNVLLALEPVATRVFAVVSEAAAQLPGILERVGAAFQPLKPIFSFIGDNIVPILAGLVPILAAIAGPAIIGAVASLGGVFAGLAGTLAAVFSPVVLIVGAIAALVAGLVYAYTHFEGFRNVVDSVIGFIMDTIWPAIKQFASWLMDGLGVAVKAIGEVISKVWKSISDWTKEHWPQIQEAVTHVWNVISTVVSTYIAIIMAVIKVGFEVIKTIVTTVLDFIQSFWSKWGDTIMTVVGAIWDAIRAYIEMVINIISGIIEFVLAIINGDWSAAWEAIKGILVAVWDFMKAAIDAAWEIIKALFSAAIDFLKSLWSNGWEYIKTALSLVWDGIKALLGLAIDFVKSLISNWLDGLKAIWSAAWNAIKFVLSSIWDGIKAVVQGAIDFVRGVISGALETIKSIWNGAWDTIKSAASNAWNAIRDGVSNGINTVIGVISSLPGRIRDFVGDVLSAGASLGGALLDGVKNAITGAWGLAGDLANGIMGAVKGAWNTIADKINDFVPNQLGWGDFSIDIPDNPIPKFYARGGIVTTATQAIVGEAGPEAIIPLTDLRRARAVLKKAGVDNLFDAQSGKTTNYMVNVYPAQATVDEAYLERLLRRREALAR